MKKLTVVLASLVALMSAPVVKAAETEPVVTETTAPDAATRAELDKAVAEFNTLSKQEKKSRFKEVKKLVKQYKADKKAGKMADDDTNTILLAILAILLPPLAIYLKERTLSWKFWVSLIFIIPLFFGGWFFWLGAVVIALLTVFDVI